METLCTRPACSVPNQKNADDMAFSHGMFTIIIVYCVPLKVVYYEPHRARCEHPFSDNVLWEPERKGLFDMTSSPMSKDTRKPSLYRLRVYV